MPGKRIQVGDLPSYLTSGSEKLSPRVTDDAVSGTPDTAGSEESLDWAGIERKMIVDALVKASGRRSKAAQLLGWGRSTLWRKMKQYGITASKDTMDVGE